MISVACDICGQNYELADHLEGKLQKCRECDTRFEVSEANAPLEPDAETDEATENSFVGVWRIFRGVATGIAILAACGWMTALLFYDPWQRPPLEFQTRGKSGSSRRAASGPVSPNVSRPVIVPSTAQPAMVPPSNPIGTAGTLPAETPPAAIPPTAQSIMERHKAVIDRQREDVRNRIQNRMRQPQFPGPPGAGPTAPGQPPAGVPRGPMAPRFAPGNIPNAGPPAGSRPEIPGRP